MQRLKKLMLVVMMLLVPNVSFAPGDDCCNDELIKCGYFGAVLCIIGCGNDKMTPSRKDQPQWGKHPEPKKIGTCTWENPSQSRWGNNPKSGVMGASFSNHTQCFKKYKKV